MDETQTRIELINPALHESGWTDALIREERTPGDKRVLLSLATGTGTGKTIIAVQLLVTTKDSQRNARILVASYQTLNVTDEDDQPIFWKDEEITAHNIEYFDEPVYEYSMGAGQDDRVSAMCKDLFQHLLDTGGPHQKAIIFCARDHHATPSIDELRKTWVTPEKRSKLLVNLPGGERAASFSYKNKRIA